MTKECSYCSVRRRNPDGLGFGKNIRSETKYVNGQTRTASVYMVNVDHKNVRLRSELTYDRAPWTMFNLKIKYCPWCGREFGKVENHD